MIDEKRREYQRQWKLKHKERLKAQNAEWYQQNKLRHRAMNDAWVAANPERSRQIKAEWKRNNPARQMFSRAKLRAKKDGREFSITLEDIVIPEYCPALGIRLTWGEDTGKIGPGNMTLDRVDNTKGYVKGNVQVISWRANAIKRDATLQELWGLVCYIEKKTRGIP